MGSFSYTSHAGLMFIWGVSLTHPVLASFFYLGSFSYTSHAGFIFIWEFHLHTPCWLHFYLGSFTYFSVGSFSYTSHVRLLFFMWGASPTHPMLTLFLCGEFLLHIPRCLHFYAGSFSYTSRDGFNLISGVSFTPPMLDSFLLG